MPKSNAQLPGRRGEDPPRPPLGAPDTRERLLAGAISGIARDGWGGVTTRRVAELAGVNAGVVHYHFGSMAELRRAAVAWAMSREVSAPMAALLESPSVSTGVTQCLDAVASIDPTSETTAVLSEAMLAATRDEQLREAMRTALDAFRSVLADRIAREHGADPAGSAALVAAALDGILLHRLVEPGFDARRTAAPLVAALLLPCENSVGGE